MTSPLFLHIQQLLPGQVLPQQELAPYFHTRSVKKGTLLLPETEPCQHIYFVNTGCLYLFYRHNEEQRVIHFAPENWWLTDYKTFGDGKPAVYAIAAMEASEITVLHRKDYEALLLQFPFMALYFNKIHERAYGAALFKQKTYATIAKPDFYRHFKNTYPALLRRIPDALFASYMGVSLETFNIIQAETVS